MTWMGSRGGSERLGLKKGGQTCGMSWISLPFPLPLGHRPRRCRGDVNPPCGVNWRGGMGKCPAITPCSCPFLFNDKARKHTPRPQLDGPPYEPMPSTLHDDSGGLRQLPRQQRVSRTKHELAPRARETAPSAADRTGIEWPRRVTTNATAPVNRATGTARRTLARCQPHTQRSDGRPAKPSKDSTCKRRGRVIARAKRGRTARRAR